MNIWLYWGGSYHQEQLSCCASVDHVLSKDTVTNEKSWAVGLLWHTWVDHVLSEDTLTNEKSWAVGRYLMSLLIIFSTGSTNNRGIWWAISPKRCVNYWKIKLSNDNIPLLSKQNLIELTKVQSFVGSKSSKSLHIILFICLKEP